jgi:diguanylate cyclase (GGDEF)-like protein
LQSLAESAGEHLALALANLRLRESLRQQSIRDPLTGLFNRRYLEETLERELARSRRSGGKLGVLFVDVDHFKRLNDSEGHDAGDAALRKLGAVMIACFRSSDVVCRYGGEELAVVLPDIDLENLRKRAEVLRESVQRMSVVVNAKMIGAITVSIGASLFPDHGDSAAMLLHNADQALYAAKREGRNRVVLARTPNAPPAANT